MYAATALFLPLLPHDVEEQGLLLQPLVVTTLTAVAVSPTSPRPCSKHRRATVIRRCEEEWGAMVVPLGCSSLHQPLSLHLHLGPLL